MTAATITAPWRKSSFSVGNGACAEAASTGAAVLVRDSTDRSGPVVAFGTGPWRAFVRGVKGGAR